MVANKRGQGRGLRGWCFHPSWPMPHIKHPGKFVASDNLLQLDPAQLLGQPRDDPPSPHILALTLLEMLSWITAPSL